MGRFLTLTTFVFLALGVIAATIPSFVDWQTYREPIEKAASDAIGRDVKITGRVGFTVLPYPSVDLGGVTVSNQQGGRAENLLTLQTLSAKLALAPLLRGAVQIETFVIEGADLALERGASSVNWAFAKGTKSGQTAGGTMERILIKAIRDISIDDFSAKDVKVSYADIVSGQTLNWEIKHGQASLASMNGPFEAEGRMVLGGKAFYVKGKIGATRPDHPRPVILDARTSENLVVTFDGKASRKSGELVMTGKTQMSAPQAHQLALAFAALTRTDARPWGGKADLALPGKMTGVMEISAGAIKAQKLDFELGSARGTGTLDLTLAKSVTGQVRIDAPVFDLDELIAALPKTHAKGIALKSGPDVNVDILVAARTATFRKTRLDDVDFSVKFMKSGPALASFNAVLPGKTRAVYTMRKDTRARGTLEIETASARQFLTWMGVNLEGSRKRAFRTLTLAGDVIIADKDIKLTGMKAALDGVKIEGALVRTRTQRPSFGANLKVMGLDLARFGTGANVPDWLKYMGAFDVNAILKLRQFSGFELERRSVDMKAQMVRGALTVEDLQLYGSPDLRLRGKLARDAGGALAGTMRVDGKNLELCSLIENRAALKVPGCQGNPAFTSTGKFTVAAGKVSGDVVAAGKGMAFDGAIGGLETIFGQKFQVAFDGKGKVGKVSYALSGRADDKGGKAAVKVNLKAQAPDLGSLLTPFGNARPWSGLLLDLIEDKGTATLVADVDIVPERTTFNSLAFTLDEASLSGSGVVEKGDSGQKFDLKLVGQNLTLLEPYQKSGWSNENLTFELPGQTSGTLALDLTNTLLGGISVPAATLEARVKSGGLVLDLEKAAALSGQWSGTAIVHKGKSGLIASAKGKVSGVDLKDFLALSLGTKGLAGSGDLKFDVSASGKSWASLVKSSAGMATLGVPQGTLSGFDLAGFSSQLAGASGELGARLAVEDALSRGLTQFTDLTSEMTLANGKLQTISLTADLDGAAMSGDAAVDLAALTVKGKTFFELTAHQELPDLRNVLTGTLKKPQSRWDTEELVLKFAEAWLLANQTSELPSLPGSNGGSIMSEELGDLKAAEGP